MIIIALLLIIASLAMSNGAIEIALLGESTGSLQWGPTLFRALLLFHGLLLIAFAIWRKRQRASASAGNEAVASESTGVEPTPAAVWVSLVGLTFVGGVLRFWKLGACLWWDEIDTVVNILRDPVAKIVTNFSSQNQHMFYSVLARTCIAIFGEGPSAARLPSVIFGLLSIWALFLLGRRILGIGLSVLACCLMTFSYHHVWFSQNARGYMGLLFFSILSTWLLIEARRRIGSRWWIAYAIALALGSWTHLTMVFVAVSHAMLYVVDELRRGGSVAPGCDRPRRWWPLLAWILSGSLTLQLYALGLPEFLGSALHEESNQSEWTNPLWVITETIRNLAGAGLLANLVVATGSFILLLGWWKLLRHESALAWMMVFPGVLAGGTMILMGHNLWPRFFFFCMGFAILLAVSGVMQCVNLFLRSLLSQEWRRRVGTLAVFSMIVLSAATLPRNYAYPKQDFIGARDFVDQQRQAEDAVVGVGLAGKAYDLLYAQHWSVAQTIEELDRVLAEHPRTWLIYTIPIEVRDFHPGMWERIEERFEKIRVFPGTLGAGAVTVCRTRA